MGWGLTMAVGGLCLLAATGILARVPPPLRAWAAIPLPFRSNPGLVCPMRAEPVGLRLKWRQSFRSWTA